MIETVWVAALLLMVTGYGVVAAAELPPIIALLHAPIDTNAVLSLYQMHLLQTNRHGSISKSGSGSGTATAQVLQSSRSREAEEEEEEASTKTNLHIVQLRHGRTPADVPALKGMPIVSYIPHNAWVVQTNPVSLRRAEEETHHRLTATAASHIGGSGKEQRSSSSPDIRWTGPYPPEAKRSPKVQTALYQTLTLTARAHLFDPTVHSAHIALNVDVVPTQAYAIVDELKTDLKALLDKRGNGAAGIVDATIRATHDSGIVITLRVFKPGMKRQGAQRLAANLVQLLTAHREVHYFAVKYPTKLHNKFAKLLTMDNSTFAEDVVPLYHAKGLHGDAEIVGVLDSGLDTFSCFFHDANTAVPFDSLSSIHRKIVKYEPLLCPPSECGGVTGDKFATLNSHGTHVVGTILGNSTSESASKAQSGVAPRAKVYFQDAGGAGGGLFTTFDAYTGFLKPAYDAGARVHSNSWGCSVPADGHLETCGSYGHDARRMDQFMHDHDDMIILVAAGNDGGLGLSKTVGEPATLKNGISVGATSSSSSSWAAYSPGTSQIVGIHERNALAVFSSHGPLIDGRIKPDVVAPGHQVSSAQGDNVTAPWCSTVELSGTSMATPVVAGIVTLAREYFKRGFYPAGTETANYGFSPRGSLLKALIVNSGQAVTSVEVNGPLSGDGINRTPRKRQAGTRSEILAGGSTWLLEPMGVTDALWEITDVNENIKFAVEPDDIHSTAFVITSMRQGDGSHEMYMRAGNADMTGFPAGWTAGDLDDGVWTASHTIFGMGSPPTIYVVAVCTDVSEGPCIIHFSSGQVESTVVGTRAVTCAETFDDFPMLSGVPNLYHGRVDEVVQAHYFFNCPSDCAGTVHGDGLYATTSSICSTARYAGVIEPNSGIQEVAFSSLYAQCYEFTAGGSKNGVTSTAPGGSCNSEVPWVLITELRANKESSDLVIPLQARRARGPNSQIDATGAGRVVVSSNLPVDRGSGVMIIHNSGYGSLKTGGVHTYCYMSLGASESRTTLVWTDVAGSSAAAIALVNDLDLELVYVNEASRFSASDPMYSIYGNYGTSPDRLNNVESMYVGAAAGMVCMQVKGYSVPLSSPQKYALVTAESRIGSGSGSLADCSPKGAPMRSLVTNVNGDEPASPWEASDIHGGYTLTNTSCDNMAIPLAPAAIWASFITVIQYDYCLVLLPRDSSVSLSLPLSGDMEVTNTSASGLKEFNMYFASATTFTSLQSDGSTYIGGEFVSAGHIVLRDFRSSTEFCVSHYERTTTPLRAGGFKSVLESQGRESAIGVVEAFAIGSDDDDDNKLVKAIAAIAAFALVLIVLAALGQLPGFRKGTKVQATDE